MARPLRDQSGVAIQLCLVNNDPTSTLLITTSGQPLYSISTTTTTTTTTTGARGSRPRIPSPASSLLRRAATTGSLSSGFLRSRSSSSTPSTTTTESASTVGPIPALEANTSNSEDKTPPSACPSHESTTTITRLDDYDVTTGHVETTVGILTSSCSQPSRHPPALENDTTAQRRPERRSVGDMTLELCEMNVQLSMGPVPPCARKRAVQLEGRGGERSHGVDEEGESSSVRSGEEWVVVDQDPSVDGEESGVVHTNPYSSWEFIGPDNKHYKWQMLGPAPVLTLVDTTAMVVPIARFRRAKLGIVSRPRKGFIEIFPTCPNMDLAVTTFVGFMKHRVLPLLESSPNNTREDLTPPSSLTNTTHSCPTSPALPGPSWPVGEPLRRQRSSSSTSSLQSLETPPPPYLPPRFHCAAALARKHSRSPPVTAITFPPYAVKPRIRDPPTSGVLEAD